MHKATLVVDAKALPAASAARRQPGSKSNRCVSAHVSIVNKSYQPVAEQLNDVYPENEEAEFTSFEEWASAQGPTYQRRIPEYPGVVRAIQSTRSRDEFDQASQSYRRSRSLMYRIKSTTTWPQLSEIYYTHLPDLSHIHLASMFTHLAHLTPPATHHSPSSPLEPHFANTLLNHSLLSLPSLKPKQLSNLVWASCQLHTHIHPDNLRYLLRSLEPRLPTFTPQDLASIAWCLARASIPVHEISPTWHTTFLAASQPLLPSFTPQNLANTIWALAILGSPLPDSFRHAFLSRCEATLKAWHPNHFANVMWSLSKLNIAPPVAWVEKVMAASSRHLRNFRASHLRDVAWALALWRAPPQPHWMSLFLKECDQKVDQMTPWMLTDLVCALEGIGCRGQLPSGFLSVMLLKAEEDAGRFPPAALPLLLRALARLGCEPSPSWMDKMLCSAQQRLGSFRTDDIAQLLHAIGQHAYSPPSHWLEAATSHLQHRLPQCSNTALVQTALGLSGIGHVPSPDFLKAMLELVEQRSGKSESSSSSSAAGVRRSGDTTWQPALVGSTAADQEVAVASGSSSSGSMVSSSSKTRNSSRSNPSTLQGSSSASSSTSSSAAGPPHPPLTAGELATITTSLLHVTPLTPPSHSLLDPVLSLCAIRSSEFDIHLTSKLLCALARFTPSPTSSSPSPSPSPSSSPLPRRPLFPTHLPTEATAAAESSLTSTSTPTPTSASPSTPTTLPLIVPCLMERLLTLFTSSPTPSPDTFPLTSIPSSLCAHSPTASSLLNSWLADWVTTHTTSTRHHAHHTRTTLPPTTTIPTSASTSHTATSTSATSTFTSAASASGSVEYTAQGVCRAAGVAGREVGLMRVLAAASGLRVRLDGELLARAAGVWFSEPGAMEGVEVGQVLRSLTRVGHVWDEEMLVGLAGQVAGTKGSAGERVDLVVAMAEMQARLPSPLVQELIAPLLPSFSTLTPSQSCQLTWALARLGAHPHPRLITILIQQVASSITPTTSTHNSATPHTPSTSTSVTGVTSVTFELPSGSHTSTSASPSLPLPPTPQEASQILWAVVMLGYQPPTTSTCALMSIVESGTSALRASTLSDVLWAAAKLGYRPERGVEEMVGASYRVMGQLSPGGLVRVLYAMARWGAKTPQWWMDAAVGRLLELAGRMKGKGKVLALAIGALARMDAVRDVRAVRALRTRLAAVGGPRDAVVRKAEEQLDILEAAALMA